MTEEEKAAIEAILNGIRRATSGADAKGWADAYTSLMFIIGGRAIDEAQKAKWERQEAKVADA